MAADESSHVPSAAPPGPSATPPAATVASVARERRDDALTGLPLLRYRFTGSPTLRPGDPAPDGAWRVLRVDGRDGVTSLDLETHAGAEPLSERPAAVDDLAAGAALATAVDARTLGVAHGDLGVHRLWRRGDRIWVEGYGVPWRAGATPEDDERALAADLLALAGTRLSSGMRARLAAVRDGGEGGQAAPSAAAVAPDPEPRPAPPPGAPSAAPGAAAAAAPPAAPPAPTATRPSAEPVSDRAAPTEDADPAAAAPTAAADPDAATATPTEATDPDAATAARTAATDPGPAVAARTVATPTPRPASGPHPLATPRTGSDDEGPRIVRALRDARVAVASAAAGVVAGVTVPAWITRRHAWLMLALVLSAGAWVGLASWSPPGPVAASFVSRVVGHVVDVRIEPAGLPPVSLVVVESPPGSRLSAGAVVGSVPSKVLLDRDGVWRLQARFGATSSQVVVLVTPDEQVLVVPFPTAPPTAAP